MSLKETGLLIQLRSWLAPPVFEDEEKTRVASLLNAILWLAISILTLRLISLFVTSFVVLIPLNVGLILGIDGILIGLLFLLRKGYVQLSSVLLVSMAWLVLTTVVIRTGGINGFMYSAYTVIILIAGLSLGGWGAIIYTCLSVAFGFVLFILQSQGTPLSNDTINLTTWFGAVTVHFLVIAMLVYFYHRRFMDLLTRVRHQEQELVQRNQQLEQVQPSLEERVFERTSGLAKVASLSEHLSAILNLDDLLAELVNQLKKDFNYYHVHIYLVDEERQNLLIAEGTGEVGSTLKAAGHYITLDAEISLVAQAAREKRIVQINDVKQEPMWLPNPLLPSTASEIASPIILDGQTEGVLDIQSEKLNHFTEDDVYLLRLITSQLSVSLENVRLFTQTQDALDEARILQQRYQMKSWETYRQTMPILQAKAQRTLGLDTESDVASDRQQVYGDQSPEEALNELKQEAIRQVRTVVSSQDQEAALTAMITPLKIGNRVIGTLGVRDQPLNRQWTEEERIFIDAVSQQVTQALENAQLFDQIQQRAAREQLTREITDKMRAIPDVETIIQTGLAELTKALGVSRGYVKLSPEAPKNVSANGSTLADKDEELPL